jgi:hypothetical protein
MKRFKPIPDKAKFAIINEVKLMLASHRDCLWTRWETCSHSRVVDPRECSIVANEGYYGEAFGIMRGLAALGYGFFGPDTLNAVELSRSDVPEHNLKWWFRRLQDEYLDEEGFYDKTCCQATCKTLLEKYRQLIRR